MRHVVVAGATGLVGQELIRLLHERPEVSFTALVRQEGRLKHLSDRVREVVFDFGSAADYGRLGTEIPCEVLLCALGTTLKAAGSPEAFRAVDFGIPKRLLDRLRQLEPPPVLGLVSSAGADHPRGLYLQVKADLEQEVLDSGLPYVIARPGLLLGERAEPRPLERLAAACLGRPYLALARAFLPRSRKVWKYAPIEAEKVAAALVRTCVDEPPLQTGRVLSGLVLHHPILQG